MCGGVGGQLSLSYLSKLRKLDFSCSHAMMTEQLSLSCPGAAQPELPPPCLTAMCGLGAAQPELPIEVAQTRYIHVLTQ